jgi:hypothetical protein
MSYRTAHPDTEMLFAQCVFVYALQEMTSPRMPYHSWDARMRAAVRQCVSGHERSALSAMQISVLACGRQNSPHLYEGLGTSREATCIGFLPRVYAPMSNEIAPPSKGLCAFFALM